MTIQATAWAFEQPVPGKAKLVLLALANRTDHVNGRCELDIDAVAREATLTSRGIWPYVGALVRNGYVRRGEDGIVWLVLDRPAGVAWEWHQGADVEAEDEATEVAPPTAPYVPAAFKPEAQTVQRATEAQENKTERVFVIEDSRAWQAWSGYRRAQGLVGPLPTCAGSGENIGKRGWFMPTLFPPSEKGTVAASESLPESKSMADTG